MMNTRVLNCVICKRNLLIHIVGRIQPLNWWLNPHQSVKRDPVVERQTCTVGSTNLWFFGSICCSSTQVKRFVFCLEDSSGSWENKFTNKAPVLCFFFFFFKAGPVLWPPWQSQTKCIVNELFVKQNHIRLFFSAVTHTVSSKCRRLQITIRHVIHHYHSDQTRGEQQGASLTSRTSALKRHIYLILLSFIPFPNIFTTVCSPQTHFQQVNSLIHDRISPTASYIVSFRHFQSLTISTVTFLFRFPS